MHQNGKPNGKGLPVGMPKSAEVYGCGVWKTALKQRGGAATPPPTSRISSPRFFPLFSFFHGCQVSTLALDLALAVLRLRLLSSVPRMSHDRPPLHHLLHADGLLPAEAVSPPSTADVSLAELAGASAADFAQMSIVACLQALQAIEDPSARRARTAEVHELMVAQWRKSSRYKSTMARHLVEDVRPTCAYMTIPIARHRLIPILSTHRSTQCFAPDSTLF